MTRSLMISATAALILLAPAAAIAQANPSADQIIKSLKPSGPSAGITRGLRPAAPNAATAEPSTQPAHPTAPPVNPPARTAGAIPSVPPPMVQTPAAKPPSTNLTVLFANGSADLTPQAARTLDELGKALTSQDLSGFRFRIEGHTDTVGSSDLNKALSAQRAAAVAGYLNSKFNIPTARLETVGMGDSNPLVATPPQTSEPRNRRVQVVNIGA